MAVLYGRKIRKGKQMLRIISKAVDGVLVDIDFAVQTRCQDKVCLKDTICFGVMQEPADSAMEVTMFHPAIAYQSAKDNFNKAKGKKIAFTRFLERNNIGRLARTEAWAAFNEKFK